MMNEKNWFETPILHERRQHTHGSVLSHLSLDALHREQDRVNLRTPDFEPGEALMLESLFILSGGMM